MQNVLFFRQKTFKIDIRWERDVRWRNGENFVFWTKTLYKYPLVLWSRSGHVSGHVEHGRGTWPDSVWAFSTWPQTWPTCWSRLNAASADEVMFRSRWGHVRAMLQPGSRRHHRGQQRGREHNLRCGQVATWPSCWPRSNVTTTQLHKKVWKTMISEEKRKPFYVKHLSWKHCQTKQEFIFIITVTLIPFWNHWLSSILNPLNGINSYRGMEVGSKKLLWSGGRLRRAMEVGSKELTFGGWLKCGAMQRP